MTSDPPDRSDGGPGTSRELLPEVYDELRKLARARLSRERYQITLQPTALVHEAYLRVGSASQRWDRRGHFFAAAALAMRRILVERARHHQRLKRGAGAERVDLDTGIAGTDPRLTDLVAIDEALTQLEQIDARKAQVVSLRYFAGLSIEETAAALDISPATVKNEWKFARAWLYRALDPAGREPPDVVDGESWRCLYRLLSGRLPFDLAGAPFAEALRRVLDADQMPLGLTDADLRAFVEGRPLRLGDHPMRARRSIAPERRLLIASTAVAFIAGALTAYALFALLR